MVLFSPARNGPLRHVSTFHKYAAGAELNFSIALSRLGLRAGLISRVGRDEFGTYILSCMKAEGLDTGLVARDDAHPTGVYFKEYSGIGDPRVYYYRRGSAASALSPSDISEAWLDGVRLVHLSGITPALSASAHEASLALLAAAKSRGVTISFDPNVRIDRLHALDTVRSFMAPFISKADLLLLNQPEFELLFDATSLEEKADHIFGLGPKVVVLKQGAQGASAASVDSGVIEHAEPYSVARYVDPVGAGDGFDAGFVFGYLSGWPMPRSLALGNYVGASATAVTGDYEGYPPLEDFLRVLRGNEPLPDQQ